MIPAANMSHAGVVAHGHVQFGASPLHSTISHETRKQDEILSCRLAMAERDLQVARTRGDMNGVERAIADVNRFRVKSGLPCVPLLPKHVRHPSLKGRVGRFPNGTPLYRFGFGFHVGQRVIWQLSPRNRALAGVVEQIFEYGRNPVALFKPAGGAAFWVGPKKLKAENVDVALPPADKPTPAMFGAKQLELDFQACGESLLLMPCSGMKLAQSAPAGEIYTGVMWQTLRANGPAPVCMAILSAKHGVVLPSEVIDPYELRMDEQRARELLAQINTHVRSVRTAVGTFRVDDVFIAGSKLYRDVALAIVERLKAEGAIDPSARVDFTQGGIGEQRAQLGAYLRSRQT